MTGGNIMAGLDQTKIENAYHVLKEQMVMNDESSTAMRGSGSFGKDTDPANEAKAGRGLLCGLARGGGSYDATGLHLHSIEGDESIMVQLPEPERKQGPQDCKQECIETFLVCDSEEELELGEEAYGGADYSNVSESLPEVEDFTLPEATDRGMLPEKQHFLGHGPEGAYTLRDWRAIQEASEWIPLRPRRKEAALQQWHGQSHPTAGSSTDGHPQEMEPAAGSRGDPPPDGGTRSRAEEQEEQARLRREARDMVRIASQHDV